MRRQLVIVILSALLAIEARAFETNGRHWDTMPIPYYINPTNCPVLDSGQTIDDVLQAATRNWSQVSCADVRFSFLGHTDATWDKDGKNTVFCVDSDWNYTQGAAGATLWLPSEPDEPNEVDLALNVSDFTWRMGGADATTTKVLDPVAVVTHEFGHWLGLGHSDDPYATMYYAYLPNGMGATLSADDEAGICSLYPSASTMCTSEEDCEDGYSCISIEGIAVCQEPHDGPGAFCSKDYINCDGMCWVSFFECSQICVFTRLDSTDGYCAPLCNDSDCPEGFTCQYIAQYDVNICTMDQTDEDGGVSDGGDSDGTNILDGADANDHDGGQQADQASDNGQASNEDGTGQDAGTTDSGSKQKPQENAGCACNQSPQSAHGIYFLVLLMILIKLKNSG